MHRFLKTLTVSALSFATVAAFAAPPRQLITQNLTNVQSNAYVGPNFGTASPHPTQANSTNQVFWGVVQVICGKRSGLCQAMIKMQTDSTPVNLGVMTVNLDNGDINPKILKAHGYTMTVIGPGQTRITQD